MQWVLKPYLKSQFLLQQKNHAFRAEAGTNHVMKKKAEDCLSLSEFFHFWLHCGGNLEYKLPEGMRIPPPILLIPDIVRVNGTSKDIEMNNLGTCRRYYDTIAGVPLESFRNDFRAVKSSGHRTRNSKKNARGVKRHVLKSLFLLTLLAQTRPARRAPKVLRLRLVAGLLASEKTTLHTSKSEFCFSRSC